MITNSAPIARTTVASDNSHSSGPASLSWILVM
jgi:hypothetical protein